jgi:hypothetical protein
MRDLGLFSERDALQQLVPLGLLKLGTRSQIPTVGLADFVSALPGDHYEKETNDLRHELETMVHDLLAKNKPPLEIPVTTFSRGPKSVLIEPGLILSTSSGIAFRNVGPN